MTTLVTGVPDTLKVNGKALTGDVVLGPADIGTDSLPEPDVWAPLNDNLRLLAGTGSVTTSVEGVPVSTRLGFTRASAATYIDKSGALRTAAINEPRFEREGLLIEGQSTNLVTISEGWPTSQYGTGWVHSPKDAEGWIVLTGGSIPAAEGSYRDVAGATVVGKTTTFSVDIKKTAGLNLVIRSYNTENPDGFGTQTIGVKEDRVDAAPNVVTVDMGTWWRISITRTFGTTGNTIYRIYPFGSVAGASGSVTYRRLQVEELPFATSYIPTTGAVATRAGDACSLPWAGNIESIAASNTVTAGLEYNFLGAGVNHTHRILFNQHGGTGANYILRLDNKSPTLSFFRGGGTNAAANAATIRKGVAATVIHEDNTIKLAVNGQLYGGGIYGPVAPGTPALLGIGGTPTGAYSLFGHIRNFRIWNTALTDAQLKGLR